MMYHKYYITYKNGLIDTNLNKLIEDCNSYKIVCLTGGLSTIENKFRVNKFNLRIVEDNNMNINYNINNLIDIHEGDEDTMNDDDRDEGYRSGTTSRRIRERYFRNQMDVIATNYLTFECGKEQHYEIIHIYFGINSSGEVVSMKIDKPIGLRNKLIDLFEFDIDVEINETGIQYHLN